MPGPSKTNKVKIFTGTDFEKLQKQVDAFLEKHTYVDMIGFGGGTNQNYWNTLIIIYK